MDLLFDYVLTSEVQSWVRYCNLTQFNFNL